MQNLLLKWMDWRDMLIHKILNESRNDMKRFCKTFIVLFFISIIVTTISCNSKQDAISRLETLYEELQQNGDDYTADDWDAVITEMNDIDNYIKQYQSDYSEEEIKEIGRLKGLCLSIPSIRLKIN